MGGIREVREHHILEPSYPLCLKTKVWPIGNWNVDTYCEKLKIAWGFSDKIHNIVIRQKNQVTNIAHS